jgi:hypothetical protein
MLNNLNNSTSNNTNTKSTSAEKNDLNRIDIDFSRLDDDLIAHLLSHALLDSDTENFIEIYDQIPASFSQLRVSSSGLA